ncbi:hypothetical protein F9278_41490 [Streptomyces phaeolivaceus]|uniref:Uncharacterized protein n=1 Tax=Streptomyces phaeolivaceus TaxID=2653200 RepID=A0A5P8KE26_9ACTN|nr:hypothetical protein F9278_41490 [Streptomyces phaeolivaceus]
MLVEVAPVVVIFPGHSRHLLQFRIGQLLPEDQQVAVLKFAQVYFHGLGVSLREIVVEVIGSA